jgi:DNA (cytosine-5)-methyltransferase 1
VLRKHWPDVPIHGDIREFDGLDADVFSGGFPCTQTSIAASIHGKRTGLDGADSGLWYEYLRLVERRNPAWVVVENPGGVRKWEGEIQGGLESLGYAVSRLASEASDFGLPHRRKRYFYAANRDGKRLALARPTGSPSTRWAARLAADGGDWLAGTPGARGSLNGLPHRVERVRALGNAVVPAQAEAVFRAIKMTETSGDKL